MDNTQYPDTETFKTEYYDEKTKGNNSVLITLIICSSLIIVITLIIIFAAFNKKDNPINPPIVEPPVNHTHNYYYDSDEPTKKTNVDAPSYDDEDVVYFYVRKSFYDEKSQIGAFHYYDNAVAYADKYSSAGYKVYSTNGNLVYSPGGSNYSSKTLYRVRKSANDAQSQVGAFYDLQNAKNYADKYAVSGYSVYTEDGVLVYSPTVPSKKAQTLYRVRKSANDAQSQIGAYNVLQNAINHANSRKNEGYKVYDENGYLVYEP